MGLFIGNAGWQQGGEPASLFIRSKQKKKIQSFLSIKNTSQVRFLNNMQTPLLEILVWLINFQIQSVHSHGTMPYLLAALACSFTMATAMTKIPPNMNEKPRDINLSGHRAINYAPATSNNTENFLLGEHKNADLFVSIGAQPRARAIALYNTSHFFVAQSQFHTDLALPRIE